MYVRHLLWDCISCSPNKQLDTTMNQIVIGRALNTHPGCLSSVIQERAGAALGNRTDDGYKDVNNTKKTTTGIILEITVWK